MKTPIFILFAALSMAAANAESPAEISIRKAQAEIAKRPAYYAPYNGLAMAYARRARETSDVHFYDEAERAVRKSLELSPDNLEALKVQTWLLLGKHEFAAALDLAAKINRKVPDDVTVYGYLVDANAELGNYQDAVRAAQWMLDLRPGNIPGLTRAAYLRELHGRIPGAIDLMQRALDATPLSESEDRAWLLTQMAHLHLLEGNLAKAETCANGALAVFPRYHYALGALGQVRMTQQRFADAVTLFEQRYQAAPHAENLFALATAFQAAGKTAEAKEAFGDFERKALAESTKADNANHELIAYYTDYAGNPAKALEIARQELTRRHDVFTLDAYAWALASSGDYANASVEMKKALAIGTKDPRLLQHAAAIATQTPAAGAGGD